MERCVSRRPELRPEEAAEADAGPPVPLPGKGEPEGEKRVRLWKFSWMLDGRVRYQSRRQMRRWRIE